ncbi:hypothetical protein J6590_031499 [Homalodisca vitripennis]|nr:hypothetical protein J6590_031499 [Homalodisca vitripennis]
MPARGKEEKKVRHDGRSDSSNEATRKVYCDEALGHLKGGNYSNALHAYNKVSLDNSYHWMTNITNDRYHFV